MTERKAIVDGLKEVNWDFKTAVTNKLTHRWHPYPAKFIPHIPRELMRILSRNDDWLVDPFCGSGTTLVEARIKGIPSIGIDVNPLSVLISKVKSTPIEDERISDGVNFVMNSTALEIKNAPHQTRLDDFSIKESMKDTNHSLEMKVPSIPNIEYWFEPHIIQELAALKAAISMIRDKDVRDFLSVAFSSIIVRVSNQDSNTRYVRREKGVRPLEALDQFEKKTKSMQKGMRVFREDAQNVGVKTYCADSRSLEFIDNDSIQLIVTSPPYLNAYDYHLYHRFRLFWLDMNPVELKKLEIGAHLMHSYSDDSVDRYFNDMMQCLREMYRILHSGGFAAIVIGSSIVKGNLIDSASEIRNLSKNVGFEVISILKRKVDSASKSFNPQIARLKTESIIVLEKQ